MMAPFMQGFLILGGVNEHNDVEEDFDMDAHLDNLRESFIRR